MASILRSFYALSEDPRLANIKSAQKQNRKRIKREARNRAKRSELRTAIKKLRSAIATKDPAKAKAALAPAVTLLDRAGRGLLKSNSTSRTISRLTHDVNALK
jgi:small subunit ribosomal protein S20